MQVPVAPKGDSVEEHPRPVHAMASESSNLTEVIAPPPVEHAVDPAGAGNSPKTRLAESGLPDSYKWPEEDDDVLDGYANLDEVAAPSPVQNTSKGKSYRLDTLEDTRSRERLDQLNRGPPSARQDRRSSIVQEEGYESYQYENLDELTVPSPIENPYERHTYRHHDLEEVRSEQQHQRSESHCPATQQSARALKSRHPRYLTHLYVTSYLILFSILGTLARLGLQALTIYPGAPVTIVQLWANFAGCLFMGYLSEDRLLFRQEWISAQKKAREAGEAEASGIDASYHSGDDALKAAKKEHSAAKKTIPLFIGLAVGFCGSLTSFSSFIRDAFLALSNGLGTFEYTDSGAAVGHVYARHPGDSVMAVLAVLLVEISLCISALEVGAQIAIGLEPFLSSLPSLNLRKWVDLVVVILAWISWIGAIVMAVWPPDRPGGPAATESSSWTQETWRGQAIFALVFAPIGCLARFHVSLRLNGVMRRFPLGTFSVNVFGTLILGMSWDLQHAPLAMAAIGGGRVGCQVLQGIEDGFCGCLTTVSTWILELKGLQRKHAYFYGAISVGLSLSMLVVVMGTLSWTDRIFNVACVT